MSLFGKWQQWSQILLVTAVLASVNAWLNPAGLSGDDSHRVDLETALTWSESEGVRWVDAREEVEFLSGHIPGAVLLNENDWDGGLDRLLSVWDADTRLVVYCGDATCNASEAVARRLQEDLGFEEVYVLSDGWSGWVGSGGEVWSGE
ncbi:MAG: rhodanese-like domain-containing protein [Verrucomicrobiota bacterium]